MKHSICAFGVPEVKYLGHIVIQNRVQVDPKKVAAMQDWTCPKTLESLREFLELTCHYRKFVKIYGKIVAPLTSLFKKNSFFWNDVATYAFTTLNDAMCIIPVLVVPGFNNTFVLECNS
jgi:hypothetical protein